MEKILPPTLSEIREGIKEAVDRQQDEVTRLQTERKGTMEGNMAFTFGYDSSVNDFDRQIVQAKNSLAYLNCHVMRTVVVCDGETGKLEAFAVVDKGGGKTIEVGGWQVQLVSTDTVAGSRMRDCKVGTVLSFGQVLSVDGGQILKTEEKQLALSLHEKQLESERVTKIEQERIAVAERAKQREQQEALHKREVIERQRLEAERRRQQYQLENQKRIDAQNAPFISLEEAITQLRELQSSGPSSKQSNVLLMEKAELLHIRFWKSHSIASATPNDSGGTGAILGGVLGALVGSLAGPGGAIFLGTVGAGIGSGSKGRSDKERWETLLNELNTLMNSLT